MSFNKPSESEYQSVGRYLDNRQALGEKEATWIQHKEDIITLRTGRDGGWLDDMVEGFLKLCHCSLIDWVFRSKVSAMHIEVSSTNTSPPPKIRALKIDMANCLRRRRARRPRLTDPTSSCLVYRPRTKISTSFITRPLGSPSSPTQYSCSWCSCFWYCQFTCSTIWSTISELTKRI
jgi:hypothetical protein